MAGLTLVFTIAAAACLVAWVGSLLTHDHSWVDRSWSILPVVYVWVFAGSAALGDPRLDLMAVLVTLWGARLTFNFARKGGYSGTEDYRWAILRDRMPRWQFELFNLFFIVIYQNLLLVLITLPALEAAGHTATRFGAGDAALALLFLLFLAGETIADQQQWDFHARKKAQAGSGQEPNPRFLSSGLWRFSRHPNFFFEQAQWWTLYLLGAVAAGTLVQWTIVGPTLLTLLFVGSTVFTESITRSKYPEYAEYQATTSPIVPWPPRRRLPETDTQTI
jgi:steroid 5-alpha reductase family enzyme